MVGAAGVAPARDFSRPKLSATSASFRHAPIRFKFSAGHPLPVQFTDGPPMPKHPPPASRYGHRISLSISRLIKNVMHRSCIATPQLVCFQRFAPDYGSGGYGFNSCRVRHFVSQRPAKV